MSNSPNFITSIITSVFAAILLGLLFIAVDSNAKVENTISICKRIAYAVDTEVRKEREIIGLTPYGDLDKKIIMQCNFILGHSA